MEIFDSVLTTSKQVYSYNKSIKLKHSVGSDNIPNIVIKRLPRKGITRIIILTNATLKYAISSSFGELLTLLLFPVEKIILKSLLKHINTGQHTTEKEQFGFRECHSIVDRSSLKCRNFPPNKNCL